MSSPSNLRSGASAAAVAALLVAGAAPARAADRVRLTPRLGASVEYASNPLAGENATPSDVITRIEPSLTVASEGRSGRSRLEVGTRGRLHTDFDELDTYDPWASFKVDRDLTPRLSLFSTGSYSRIHDVDPVDEVGELLQGERPDIQRTDVSAGFSLTFSPRSSLTFFAAGDAADFDLGAPGPAERLRDQDSRSVALAYRYLLSPLDSLTLTASGRGSEFEETGGRTQLDESVASGTAAWKRQWSPTWISTVRLGTRRLHIEGNGFAGFDFGSETFDFDLAELRRQLILLRVPLTPLPGFGDLERDDTSSAFTGGVTLVRDTGQSRLELGWSSETRPSSGQSGSLDVDSFSASYQRQLGPRLILRLAGSHAVQESASEFFQLRPVNAAFSLSGFIPSPIEVINCALAGGFLGETTGDPSRNRVGDFVCAVPAQSQVDTTVRRLNATLTWKARRGLAVIASLQLRDYDARGPVGRDYTDLRFRVGFRWNFDLDVP